MTFQKTVYRQLTTGFPGDIVRDGPKRGNVARISSATLNADGISTNRISRAFGWSGEMPALGSGTQTQAAEVNTVAVGGPVFFGVLGHPKHYALSGTAEGSLSPSYDLPTGIEAEFFDMVTGMVAEVFNETTSAKTLNYGDQVAYLSSAATAGQNPNKLPIGGLIGLAPGTSVPAGFVLIPNARIVNQAAVAASSTTAAVSAWTIIQLTQ